MTAAMDAMREHHECAYWLYGLLLVLDDEPLIVLHRATGRGFLVTISGVGSNFQLHTLLAAALIGEESYDAWTAGRPYPFMRPTVTVHGPLPASEAARWLAQVRPATRTIFGS